MNDQLDILGGFSPLVTEPTEAAVPVRAEQPRLFEPQMEGQLELGENPEQ